MNKRNSKHLLVTDRSEFLRLKALHVDDWREVPRYLCAIKRPLKISFSSIHFYDGGRRSTCLSMLFSKVMKGAMRERRSFNVPPLVVLRRDK
ncbi:hypothetical protein CDAR_542211 [Caerostris darwini]|uniref:Uncharacterized protein n=1 Tax=Caerostris darwini TaxID=1538125 RepID=A0AAV4PEW4_9ARAC|nr:hypothetical protein CDAR_542211 [Caerostris darwini]